MKRGLMALSLCLISVIALLSGCSSKIAVSAETFVSVLESYDYSVNEDFDEDADALFTAQKGDCHFFFVIYPSDSEARAVFNETQSTIENLKGSISSHTSANFDHYNSYKLTTDGMYYQICRVDNTILLAISTKENKSEIDTITKELGY